MTFYHCSAMFDFPSVILSLGRDPAQYKCPIKFGSTLIFSCSQGILVYMFRELMDYCARSISSSGHYSLAVQHTPIATYVILCFWTENVLPRVCIGGAPRGLLLPRKIHSLVSSFLSLFETVPNCVSLIWFRRQA